MKAALLILLLATATAAQTFTQGQPIMARVNHRWHRAICLNNVRYNDFAVEVRVKGRIETVAVSDVRKVKR